MRDSVYGDEARPISRSVRWRHINDQDRPASRIDITSRTCEEIAHHICCGQSDIAREKDLLPWSYHRKVLKGAEPIASIYSCVSQSGADGIVVAEVLSPGAQTLRPQAQAQAMINVPLRCQRGGHNVIRRVCTWQHHRQR